MLWDGTLRIGGRPEYHWNLFCFVFLDQSSKSDLQIVAQTISISFITCVVIRLKWGQGSY